MKIGQMEIGAHVPPFIVAEISANHNGDIYNVFRLIDEAKIAGADAVKLQCYTPDTITMESDRDDFVIKDGPWKGRTLYDLYREAHTPPDWFERIFTYCRTVRRIEVFASVFDETAIELLQRLNVSAYKIASFELTDLPLIKSTASTGKPTIISTGMASTEEIKAAMLEFPKRENLALLHCVSAYPTPANQANLPALGPLSELLGGKHAVGLSDHNLGIGVSVAAVAYGATLVEKHLTLNRSDGGPDSGFSLEPLEFAEMVKACHDAWEATQPSSSPAQKDNLQFRRSVYVTAPISVGERLTKENVRVIRPAFGLQPSLYPSVLGRKAKVALQAGSPLSLDHLL
jgi:pseudaminic acid synthase